MIVLRRFPTDSHFVRFHIFANIFQTFKAKVCIQKNFLKKAVVKYFEGYFKFISCLCLTFHDCSKRNLNKNFYDEDTRPKLEN